MSKASAGRKNRRKPPKTYTLDSPAVLIMGSDKTRVKQPFSAVPIPDDYCGWIGKVTVTWSILESRIDDLITALLADTAITPPERWERTNFKKRKTLCKDLAVSAFNAEPGILSEIRWILGEAADLHWRRNFIVHGHLQSKLHFRPPVVSGSYLGKPRIDLELTATSRHNGKQVSLTWTTRGMEDLFYAVGHVHGRLVQLTSPDDLPPLLSSGEKSRLRAFLLDSHPNLPKPPTPEGPPQPSEG